MRAYIEKLKSKDIQKRKQIFAFTMTGSMLFVGVIWIYGLGVRLGDPKVKTQSNEDIKPFKLFGSSISDTYKDVTASVGKAPDTKEIIKQEVVDDEKSLKQIDLTPVEYDN